MKQFISVLSLALISMVFINTKASAISNNVVIYQVQTGGIGTGTATQELVLLYNQSPEDINISDWCIEYSSTNDNTGFNSCATSTLGIEIWLQAGGVFSFATNEFVIANVGFDPDFMMSGGMSATGGHLRVYDDNNVEVDKLGWGGAINPEGLSAAAHIGGQLMSRNIIGTSVDTDINLADFSSQNVHDPIISGLYEIEIEIDLCTNITDVQLTIPNGFLAVEDECYEDVCPNLSELQLEVPNGYEKIGEICEEIPLEDSILFITELLPNPPSYDTDAEFIELFNPNNKTLSLAGYKIQVGPNFTKEFTFTSGFILPNEYLVFNDGLTGITLPNSNGVSLRLVSPAGNIVSTTDAYENAGDNVSWAYVDDQWIFTNQLTPDGPNKPFLESLVNEAFGVTTVYAPCPEGKYRNPETNRCRNIETAVSQLTACDEDEFRNPDTNRCRKVASSSSSLKPCDEDEERNPETNRCRKVGVLGVSSEDDLPTITDAETQSTEGSINWTVISIALFGTFGYMLYEWRSELSRSLVRLK